MEFLCIVYFEPVIFDRMTDAEKRQLDVDSLAYDAKLDAEGRLIAARALQPVAKASTVTVRASKIAAVDGPFAETKEHLGGFILVRAEDMDEARAIAAGIPLARYGKVEVRPIYDVPGA